MIFGLSAAFGWGAADLFGAIAARRMGSVRALVFGQLGVVTLLSAIVVGRGIDFRALGGVASLILLLSISSGGAYLCHYRALQLGPVAVVSPVGACYAIITLALVIWIRGDQISTVALAGGLIAILGVMVISTEPRRLRQNISAFPPGLRWAIGAAILWGVTGYGLADLATRIDWQTGLWASRVVSLGVFALLFAFKRAARPSPGGLGWAVGAGVVDLIGLVSFFLGAANGNLLKVVLASSVFPVIPVVGSFFLLGERPAANHLLGAFVTILGLVGIALG